MGDLSAALARLEKAGVNLSNDVEDRLRKHMALVREWSRVVSLVSVSDLAELETRHVIDSLSLVPVLVSRGLASGVLLDVGSGGGYPAVPLAIVLPELRLVLLERSERKVGFLRKVQGALGLSGVEVRCGLFPKHAGDLRPDAITARAVEKPERIVREAGVFVEAGAVLLCQAGDPRELLPEMFHVEPSAQRFHVEHWEDDWTREGLRRGELYVVSPAATPLDPSGSHPE